MNAPESVAIIGGGTAGWMTACLLAKQWPKSSIKLIESSDIGTIGVGEGSTPYLKHFFNLLGLDESQWMPQCDATYKVGITFSDWTESSDYSSYFHPFFTPLDLQGGHAFFDAANSRRTRSNGIIKPDDFFIASEIARLHLSPVPNRCPGDIDYAYHFDAGKLGTLLKNYACQRGVVHVVDTLCEVHSSQQNIERIVGQNTGEHCAQLYVDCSGFVGLLAKKSLKRRFHSYSDTLFNDRAVALPTDHSSDENPLTPHTISQALTNGWMWKIPLTARMGNGYVYASQFCDAEQAENELRTILESDDQVPARHLKMEVGRLENHWQGNCVAIGLSQGFIEPLEATALMLVQYAITSLIDNYTHNSDSAQATYNREMNRMFDGIRDYIAAHYYLNTRNDSAYWQACRNDMNVPDVLAFLLKAWDGKGNFDGALNEVDRELVYLKPSWYCIFAGMGRFPEISGDNQSLQRPNLTDMAAKYFPSPHLIGSV